MTGTREPALKRVLVTGATGFLGSRLVRKFLELNYDVTILKRSFSDTRRISTCLQDLRAWDLDRGTVDQAFAALGPFDAVVHTATSYGRNGESAATVFDVNLAFPLALLQAAITSGTPQFLNTGTVLPPLMNPYALSKKQFEDWGRLFAGDGKIAFVNILLEHMFGPGDDDSKFTTFIIRSLAKNVPEIPLTPGEQQRDFVYIEDAVNAYVSLLGACSGKPGYEEFSLGSGEAVSIRSFVERVKNLTGADTRLLFGEKSYRDHEVMLSRADISRLKSLGWHPVYSLEQGILETLEKEGILP